MQSVDPALLRDEFNTYPKSTSITLALTITTLNLDESTDLGPTFSTLYLGQFRKDKIHSYFSIKEFMYGGNYDRLLITLDKEVLDDSSKIDICLISGLPQLNNSIRVKNKWGCKSFRVSELLEMKEKGYEFTLEGTSAKTPKLDLLIHPYQSS